MVKKILSAFMLMLLCVNKPQVVVYAEEAQQEEVVDEQEPSIEEIINNLDEDTLKEIIAEELGKVFSPEVVSNIVMVIGYLVIALKALISARKSKLTASMTATEVKNAVLAEVKKDVSDSVAEQVDGALTSVISTCNNLNDVVKVLAQVQVLAQENTPQSRVAILECISKLGVVKQELIDEGKEVIENEVQQQKQHKENIVNEIDGMKKDAVIDDGTTI